MQTQSKTHAAEEMPDERPPPLAPRFLDEINTEQRKTQSQVLMFRKEDIDVRPGAGDKKEKAGQGYFFPPINPADQKQKDRACAKGHRQDQDKWAQGLEIMKQPLHPGGG